MLCQRTGSYASGEPPGATATVRRHSFRQASGELPGTTEINFGQHTGSYASSELPGKTEINFGQHTGSYASGEPPGKTATVRRHSFRQASGELPGKTEINFGQPTGSHASGEPPGATETISVNEQASPDAVSHAGGLKRILVTARPSECSNSRDRRNVCHVRSHPSDNRRSRRSAGAA